MGLHPANKNRNGNARKGKSTPRREIKTIALEGRGWQMVPTEDAVKDEATNRTILFLET